MRIITILWIWQINAQNITATTSQQVTATSLPSATDLPSATATISPATEWATMSSTPSPYATRLVSMTPSPTPTQGPTAASAAACSSYTSPLRHLNMEDWFTIILPPAIVIGALLLWIYNIRKKNAKLKWVVSNYRQPITTLNNPAHTRVKDLYANSV